MAVDKNQAMINFLVTCPEIANSPIYFNFINAKDNNKQLITLSNEVSINQPYIDGSISKRYSLTIIDFKSISQNAIVKSGIVADENVEDMLQVQAIIDWIEQQEEVRNYPNFGTDCIIDRMFTSATNPSLNGIDTSLTPALAKYSITIHVEYLDISKVVYK